MPRILLTPVTFITVLALLCLSPTIALAQTGRHQVLVGTQLPVQWTAGYQYQFTDRFSARVQAGLLTAPYDKFIIESMNAFGSDKRLGKALDEAFRVGIVGTISPQYHFGDNYVALQGQYARLNGSISLQRAIELYLSEQFSLPELGSLPIGLLGRPELTSTSTLFITGLVYGRKFSLPNRRFTIQAEAGFSKIIGSTNRFSSNLGLLDQLPLVQRYYGQMDDRLKSSYRTYGYVPSLSVYVVYQLDAGK